MSWRLRSELTTALRTWEGNDVLRVMPAGKPYQVIHFWSSGMFTGWYVNFESPLTWNGRVGDSRDWHLDLWVSPDGEATWKDEEEAVVAAECGHVGLDELAIARAAGDAIIADVDGWLSTLGDWRDLRPNPGLRPLRLPPTWASERR